MTMNGIDISNWQRGIDLSAVPAEFVIIKATGGTGYVSDTCDTQFQQAKKLGKLRGVYHFAGDGYRDLGAEREADFFVDNTLGYWDGMTIPVLDWEAIPSDNIPANRGVGWAKAWLDRVFKRTGIKPLIYMNLSTANSFDWSPVVNADYGLWIAAYASMNTINGYQTPKPPAVRHWPFAAIFQYSSTTRLPGFGGDLDANVAYMDRAAWLRYAAKAGSTPVAPTPATPATKTIEQLAVEVIAGKWGVNKDRQDRLTKAGYSYAKVQARVNEKLGYSGAPQTYTIRKGDTLSSIAAAHGTTWQKLQQLNRIPNANVIYAGAVIRIG